MTDQLKWTPGPWVAFFTAEECGATPKDGGKGDIAHCAGHDSQRRTVEADANAHLIAAAPDLYAALDMQVRNCPQCKGATRAVDAFTWLMSDKDETPEPTDCRWCRDGRAALAKARGQA